MVPITGHAYIQEPDDLVCRVVSAFLAVVDAEEAGPPCSLTGRWIAIVRRAPESYAGTSNPERPITQQYLIGQFSTLLEQLEPSRGDDPAGAVHDLRREVECCPLEVLPKLANRAMGLTDMLCCGALERGDTSEFLRYAKVAVALGEFMDAAGLLRD